ncbi:ThiF family adenylyltransferase [Nocardioides marmoriginsengisoli]|uniref:ThiF family adenylyltransferase n=1 Tax=Nocardioides marmoriginsengisoli TaxID=661483 RepID=A0A3N0CBG3_9ACTN|nr:ThiF family adenylyltransferase [Nocardioides marmoriginsengisoli]RNL60659.1 ThiF family adenylyltransferase [Nocardioides marmoriginsengisoli]
MSGSRLVRNSPDLARLVQDGFAVRIVNGFLVVDDIPYVDDAGQIQWGHFLCPLDLAGTTTAPPATHVMCFAGGIPRDHNGKSIRDLVNDGVEKWSATPDLTATCGFSQRPEGGYKDFYEKVTYYTAMVISSAQAVNPDVHPYTFKPIQTDEDDGAFTYVDTFSSRAGITELNDLLAVKKVVIVGLGGTGAHLLDGLAKTPALTLHLYDADFFRSHNAFRAPGAASLADLDAGLTKVEYYTQMYSVMRRHIVPHPVNVTAENVAELLDADFVFLALDTGPDKEVIVKTLVENGIPFIDTGVGLSKDANGIAGQIRITTSTPGRSDHIARDGLISYLPGEDAEYDTNLQVDEINAITAKLAIIRYKKWLRFYADVEDERHTVFVVNSGDLHHRYGTSDNAHPGRSNGAAGGDPEEDDDLDGLVEHVRKVEMAQVETEDEESGGEVA